METESDEKALGFLDANVPDHATLAEGETVQVLTEMTNNTICL